jgi:mannose-6-phosphate isomerase-like protein (cupin superfamily)
MTHAPIDMFARALRLHDDGAVRDEPFQVRDGMEGWQLAAFHAETDEDVHADHWEVHPSAEEAVCCLSGGMRLILRPEEPGAREEVVRLTPGSCFIVPRGRWHRLELDGPTDLMSVTLPNGSRLEPRDA